ncbi:hypothetical protein BC835DRAFT_1409914 [Cytidiella melzeri]|nr:hypothetical protein BC835DRAFT_1409914 [Cytidiella melzeri]
MALAQTPPPNYDLSESGYYQPLPPPYTNKWPKAKISFPMQHVHPASPAPAQGQTIPPNFFRRRSTVFCEVNCGPWAAITTIAIAVIVVAGLYLASCSVSRKLFNTVYKTSIYNSAFSKAFKKQESKLKPLLPTPVQRESRLSMAKKCG